MMKNACETVGTNVRLSSHICRVDLGKLLGVNQRSCPVPRSRRNLAGLVVRRFRLAAGVSQAELAGMIQRAGWDLDRVVLVRIESGQRSLLDYEICFLLRVLGKTWADLAAELD